MTNKLEQALALAEEGFYVFPIKKNQKTPAHDGWQQEATFNAETVTELFDNKRDYNIGILATKYFKFSGHVTAEVALVVVDVDTKDGKQGNQTMLEHDMLGNDFPPTLEFITASGGRHLVYFYDYPISGGANKLGLHVDVKSNGGYIVAEGSTINENPYKRANNLPIALCPTWIVERCGRPMERSPGAQAIENLDSDQAIQRATHFIEQTALPGTPGRRNDVAYKTACKLHDFGISEPLAQEFMFTWNKLHCHPHLEIEEINAVTESAYKTAKLSAGNDSPHAEFEIEAHDPDAKPKPPKLYFKLPQDITEDFTHNPLIEDLLDQDAISILYGDSNVGKTFVAMDLAYHVAAGESWNSKRVVQGSVIYVAAEGGRSAENRILALKRHYNTNHFPLALVPCQINLFDSKEDFQGLLALIRAAEQQCGQARLIIIDTLSRSIAGGNENDSVDMGVFMDTMTHIKNRTKAHLMLVHHSGKDASRGARGHSLLRAAADTELEVTKGLIQVTKQRDMEFTKDIGFELETLTLGTNEFGKQITSCVIQLVDAEARAEFEATNRMEHRDLIAYLALQECKTGRQIRQHENVVDQKEWAISCKDFDITIVPGSKKWPSSDGSFAKAFQRTRDRLVGLGKVIEIEEKQWVFVK